MSLFKANGQALGHLKFVTLHFCLYSVQFGIDNVFRWLLGRLDSRLQREDSLKQDCGGLTGNGVIDGVTYVRVVVEKDFNLVPCQYLDEVEQPSAPCADD